MMVSPEFAATGGTCTAHGEHASHFFVHWLDFAAPLAIGGLWLWMFFTQLSSGRYSPPAIPTCAKRSRAAGGH